MRIAMVHADLPNESRGGVAFQAHYLSNALVRRGHEVTVFTFSPLPDDALYRLCRFRIAPGLRRYQSIALAFYLAATDFTPFDVVHTHGDNWLLRVPGRQVRTFHGSAIDESASAVSLKRRLTQKLFFKLEQFGQKTADVCVGVSEATRRRLTGITQVVPCGVDLTQFTPGEKAPHPAILFVGTTGGRKRGHLLAEHFTRYIRPNHPEAQLWVVAEAPINAEGVINFGRVSLDTLTDLYRRAWVFCLPSTYEGFGVPYIEAMASGTPVVATPNPGAVEVLDNGLYGLLTQDTDLGKQIERLISDSLERSAWEAKGLVRAKSFSWDAVVEQYERIYTTLPGAISPSIRGESRTAS